MTQDKDVADKLLDRNRQQLSALMDGELSPDEARFLLRRLQHDESLAQSLSRWQLCGDILRGQGQAPAPAGFAGGVAAAIANERDAAAARPAAGWRPARWGTGLALAASVAVVALFVARQTPELANPEGASQSAQLAAQGQPDLSRPDQVRPGPTQPSPVQASPVQGIAQATPDASATSAPPGSTPNPRQPGVPGTAAEIAAMAAVAELPRRAAARRSRGQSQRAATRSAARRNAEPQVAVAAAPMAPRPASATQASQSHSVPEMAIAAAGDHPATVNASTASPFMPKTDTITTRPWPRALLPAAPAGGFNVDYGRQQATGSGFYPFHLRSVPDRLRLVPVDQQSDVPATDAPVIEQPAIEQAAIENTGKDTP